MINLSYDFAISFSVQPLKTQDILKLKGLI